MVATTFLLLLVQGLLQYPQQAGDGLGEATLECMLQRAEYLNQQMTRLLLELEEMSLEQSAGAWGALLGWQFWAVLGIIVVLLVLWFGLKKIRYNPDKSSPRESSFRSLVAGEGDNVVAREETGSNNLNVEEEQDHNVESNHQSIFEEVVQWPVVYLAEHLVENMVENFNDD